MRRLHFRVAVVLAATVFAGATAAAPAWLDIARDMEKEGEAVHPGTDGGSGWYVAYGYDKLATLDVSGCPALETLAATRQYGSMEGPLRTIYMTQAQSESVTVTKNPSAQIVVK